jgi:protein tyrosine/serine phosphatase
MQRRLDLAGCLNFRDLGGYPTADGRMVRWRQVFRSDALHLLTPTDVARLRDDVGLGCVVDLRSTAELEADGDSPLVAAGITHHQLPLFDGEAMKSDDARVASITLADRYWLMAQYAKEKIGRVLTTLATADGPAVYHCAAGKDRTGVISAVILGVLGVPDEVIVADYAATKENLEAIIERLMATRSYATVLLNLPPDPFHAAAETLGGFLERIRAEYAEMGANARDAGVAPDALEALHRLVER